MLPKVCTTRFVVTVILPALAALSCSSGGGGQPPIAPPPTLAFAPPSLFATGGVGGKGLLIADVDGDGRIDVFTANQTLANVSLLRGQVDGSLANGTTLPAPALVGALVAADVNGDRHIDLVTASGANATATVSAGMGNGTFAAPVAISVPWPVRRLVVVDWNGDGVADILAASALVPEIGLLLGQGGGAFGAAVIAQLPYVPEDFVVADFDRDLRPDVVATGQGHPRIDVLRNNGAGGFLASAVTSTTPRGGKLACCDLNGDRVPDLVSVDSNLQSATVFLAVPGSSFVAGVTVGISNTTIDSLALGDLNGDGWIDLVAAAGSEVLACYGDSAGALSGAEVLWTSPSSAASVVAADMIGNGLVDVACIVGGNQVAVLRSPRSLAAGLSAFGVGTPDCRGSIGMWAVGAPTIGNATFAYTTTNGPADVAGVFMQGGPADPVGADPFGNGVLVHVGFGLLVSRLVFSDQLGSAVIHDPIPADPGLAGLPIHAQAIWLADPATTCTSSPSNLVSSRGLTVTLQQ